MTFHEISPTIAEHAAKRGEVSSHATGTTISTSCDTLPCNSNDSIKFRDDLKENNKSSQFTMKRSSGRSDALMRLIAKEMLASFLTDEDCADQGQQINSFREQSESLANSPGSEKKKSKPKKRRSSCKEKPNGVRENQNNNGKCISHRARKKEDILADIYYAHMTGGNPSESIIPCELSMIDDSVDLPDFSSFAGLDLDDFGVEDQPRVRVVALEGEPENEASTSTDSNNKDSDSGAISVEHIRKYVMAQIPKSLRDQIPEAAWGQIFGELWSESSGVQQSDHPENSLLIDGVDRDACPPVYKEVSVREEDDVSIGSEISGLTEIFPRPRSGPSNCISTNDTERILDENSESRFSSSQGSSDVLVLATDPTCIVPCAPGEQRGVEDKAAKGVQTSVPPKRRSQTKTQPRISCQGTSPMRNSVVSFSDVQIRYYERILTDNPSCQSGPSIGIGWRYKRAGIVSVDDWEIRRGDPRKPLELIMPREQRLKLLKGLGYEQKEIAESIRRNLKVKNQRRQTINNLGAQGMEEAVEIASRKVKSILRFGVKNDLIKNSRSGR